MNIIKRCLDRRGIWKESQIILSTIYHLKLSQDNYRVEYSLLDKKYKPRIVNHFEFDQEIANKRLMFLNFLEYCDVRILNLEK